MASIVAKDEKVSNIRVNWSDIVLCIMAFLVARIGIQSTYYTVGVAYVGIMFHNKTVRGWSWLFATCGILSLAHFDVDTIKYIFMFALIGIIREFIIKIGGVLNAKNQAFIVAFSIMLINLIAMGIVGFDVYRAFMGVLEAVVGAGICYLLADGIYVIRQNRKTPLTTREAVGVVFILSCIIAGFLDVYIRVPIFTEIYLKDIGTFMIMIAALYLGGMNIGVTVSVVMSSLLVMIGYMPSGFNGIYGLSTLIGGIFLPLGRVGAVLGAGIGQALGMIIFNEGQLDMPLLGAYCIAGCLSFIVPKSYFGMENWFSDKNKEGSEKEHLLRIQQVMTERLKHIVGGFEKLGESFQGLQQKNIDYTPKMINHVIEETAEKLCISCSMKNFCWDQDLKNTYVQCYQMVGAMEEQGFISKQRIPEAFNAHCLHAENFAYVLSYKLDLLKQDMIWKNRFLENRELVADELSAIAETLRNLIKEVDQKLCFDKETEERIKEIGRADGIKIQDVMVVENRGKIYSIDMHTKSCKGNKDIEGDILRSVERAIGENVVMDKHVCESKSCHFKVSIANNYQITAGTAICAKEGVSGDVHTFMEVQDDQYLLALADGMGSGMLAYQESAAAIEMLEDFIESGFRGDLAVKMINAALILKSDDEIFSTMDITLIDRRTGVAEFLKAGASTSFILRAGEILSVQGTSLPMGMIKDVHIAVQKIQLQKGDMIIMVTDGMLDTKEDILGKEETFKYFIKEVKGSDPQYMADYLMQKSKALLGVTERDDMTIVVARIW